jgi:hypothetical protein
MNITNIQPLQASKSGNNWTLTARYTATFTNEERDAPHNYTFRDSIKIMESDEGGLFGGADDPITGWVTARNFNPAENAVTRTVSTVVNGSDLDTEIGGEEVYAKVQLRNFTTGGLPVVKKTGRINLAP